MNPQSAIRNPQSAMTVAELINSVLEAIYNQFEYQLHARDFHRDRPALMKAIARVGYECEQRGWQMDVSECCQVIMAVLVDIKGLQGDVNYLPIYLHAAIGRHLGQRAEEYSARQKARGPRRLEYVTERVLRDGIEVVNAVQKKSATETLAELYVDLRRNRRKKQPTSPKQPTLL